MVEEPLEQKTCIVLPLNLPLLRPPDLVLTSHRCQVLRHRARDR